MARQQLSLLSAIMSMVLFAVVTIPADVRHALSSDQPLSWAVSIVVYATLLARRRFPIGTVAVAVIGSVVLMAVGVAYPLTLPAVFYGLYMIALNGRPARTRTVGVAVKAALLTAALITHPAITGFVGLCCVDQWSAPTGTR